MVKPPTNPVPTPKTTPRYVHIDELYLDPQNPRLKGLLTSDDQTEVLRLLWREMAVDELALSISENGYFPQEPVFAAEEKGRLVVIEGNRRVAAVKLLLHPKLREAVRATGLPSISSERAEQISRLPVITCTRDELWRFLGFKHVNGPQQWDSYSKAEYIAWVRTTLGIGLEEIARTIGDKHATVKRLYRGLLVLHQAEQEKLFSKDDRYKARFSFSHLYTGLDYPNIQKFLGIREDGEAKSKPVPKARLKELGELCVWLFGSKTNDVPPLVRTQNPDLRSLEEALKTDNGIAALRRGLPLEVSAKISKGDHNILREALVGAKQALEEALGKLGTGFKGEPDVLQLAEGIQQTAEGIVSQMQRIRARRRPQDAAGE